MASRIQWLAALGAPAFVAGIVQAATAQPVQEGPDCKTLSGEVARGQSFQKTFDDGLIFGLSPETHPSNPQGWTIEVRDAAYPMRDFVSVATPPYRSFNPRDLTTSYGYTAQAVVAMTPRHFQFALSEIDRARMASALGSLLWPADRSAGEIEAAEQLMETIDKGEGTLAIVDYELGEPDDDHPLGSITSLRFDARLCVPIDRATGEAKLRSAIAERYLAWNERLEAVDIVEAQAIPDDSGDVSADDEHLVVLTVAHSADRTFKQRLEDEAFGIFVVRASSSEVVDTIDIFPTCRWLDCDVRLDHVSADSIAVRWEGATYGDQKGRAAYLVPRRE